MKKQTVIAAALAVLLLASCSSEVNDQTAGTSSAADTQTAADTESTAFDAVPALDFGGKELRMLQQSQNLYYIDAEEETGDPVNDAIYRRNSKLEDRFNMKFHLIDRGIDFGEVSDAVRRAVDAGEDAYDLILNQIFRSGQMATSGYFQSWTEIPYIALEQPWYTKAIREAGSVADQLLMLESDLVLSYAAQTWLLLYNKTDAAALDIADLYDVVNDGKWTYDMLYELSSEAYSDLNGDGSADKDDYYGFAATLGGCMLTSCFYAGEGRMVELSDNLELSYPIENEHSFDVFGKLSELFYNNPGAIRTADALSSTRVELFPHGNILFQFMLAGDLLWEEMRSLSDEFGVLPMPKFDEAQTEYYTLVDGGADIMTIPITAADSALIGAVVEAASADSYYDLMPTYMGLAMEQKGTRDEESVAMLRFVFDSRIMDFAYLYDGGDGFAFDIANIIRRPDKMVSTLERSMKSVSAYYEKIIEEMRNAE